MSARKSSKPRKPGKTKLFEVAGHLLTPELHEAYLRSYRHRGDKGGMSHERAARVALDDVISGYRFSHARKEVLGPLYGELTTLALAVVAFMNYPLYSQDSRELRHVGCDALDRLAAEAQRAGSKLHMIAEAIRHEADEKLQDWQRRRAAYDAVAAKEVQS